MAHYNIYLDSHVNESGLGGWALVLTTHTGFKELSHHIGAIENATEEDLLVKALEEALELTTTDKARKHEYVINCKNNEVVSAYLRNVHSRLSQLKELAPHVLVVCGDSTVEGAKTASVICQHAYKFYLAGGMKSGTRSRVTVTETNRG